MDKCVLRATALRGLGGSDIRNISSVSRDVISNGRIYNP